MAPKPIVLPASSTSMSFQLPWKIDFAYWKFSYLKEVERLEQLPPTDSSLIISFNPSISTNLLIIGSYQLL
jgi:hypothetical protein